MCLSVNRQVTFHVLLKLDSYDIDLLFFFLPQVDTIVDVTETRFHMAIQLCFDGNNKILVV